MSQRYETELVGASGSTYEQAALGVMIGSFVAFALAAGTLFGWVPLAEQVGGVTAAAYFGVGTAALGLATAGLGVASRWGSVGTSPSRSVGLVVGIVQALCWLLVTGLFLGNTVGLGSVSWLPALGAGVGVGYATIALREDLGATGPTGVFVVLSGMVVLTGIISPSWTWTLSNFDATIPGTLAVPLLTMVASLLTGWASAAAYEGFGTRGRQNGAFALVSLVVLLTLSVLLFLLVFVFQRGVATVLESLQIGAGTGLLIVVTLLFGLLRSTTPDPTAADGTDKIFAFVSLAAVAVVALCAAVLLSAMALGRALTGYAVTVVPTATVGATSGLLVGTLVLLWTRTDTAWTPDIQRGQRLKRVVAGVFVLVLALTAIELVVGLELEVGGVAAVSVLLGLVLVAALGLAAARPISDPETPERLLPPASWVGRIGLLVFVLASLRVFLTGFPVGTGGFGIVTGGTVDWPFVMNPSQGLGIQRGVMPAMFGTIWIVLGAVVFAVPLALGAAVYLTEYAEDSRFTQAVDIATNGLWSTPSIVFGLFGLAFIVPRFGDSPSVLASQLVLGFMLLPLVLITSREAMKSVPDEYRDASAALGVSKWQTIRSVVVPAAMPGVITGVILGVGRIAGETAPLLLVLNGPNFPNTGPNVLKSFVVTVGTQPPFVQVSNPALLERASALPYQLYAVITAGVGADSSFGWGTTLVLLGVVLGFFTMSIATRRYFRRKLHE